MVEITLSESIRLIEEHDTGSLSVPVACRHWKREQENREERKDWNKTAKKKKQHNIAGNTEAENYFTSSSLEYAISLMPKSNT